MSMIYFSQRKGVLKRMIEQLIPSVDLPMMVRLRRELHRYPELGYELPRTTALVKRELDAMGVPYTEEYGPASVVATLNPDCAGFTIGIRADMDALPIQEQRETPYKSLIDGHMHACGHDSHTAMLLGAAKALKALESRLTCRVRLIFQPSEEQSPSGAKTLCEHGVMEGIDIILMCHVNCNDPTGLPSVCEGVTNATSQGFVIHITGKSVHMAIPHMGVDAIAVGCTIYQALQLLISRETDPFDPAVLSIGKFEGGTTTAVVPGVCTLTGSFRSLRDASRERMIPRINRLVAGIAEQAGAQASVEWSNVYLPTVHNDKTMCKMFTQSAAKIVGEEGVLPLLPSTGGEDFAWYEQNGTPGLLFGLGARNPAKDTVYPAHTALWDIDEDAMENGAKIFVQFVLDHMDGYHA